ncbi:MAG: hypothetical protein KAR05_03290 [Candidatus Omnitrophica bacterium]|nr:hypothetical protein [Candidatus Omnitrophota bacterium]
MISLKQKSFIEKSALLIALLFYSALQTNAIIHKNYAGQDFQSHKRQIERSAVEPLKTLTYPLVVGGGISTVYHFIGGRIFNLIDKDCYMEFLAFAHLVLNIFALLLFYKLMKGIIHSQIIRLSCFIFITFLPTIVIPSVVISGDAMANFLFILIAWLMIGLWKKSQSWPILISLMVVLSVVLLFAFNIKFNLGAFIVAVFLIISLFFKNKIFDFKKYLCAVILLIILPMGIIFIQYKLYIHKQIWPPTQASSSKFKDVSHINLRSLVFFRKPDVKLLDAPYFHEYKTVESRLTQPIFLMNYYSYPGLLHLALYTDVLNIYQPIYYEKYDPLSIKYHSAKDEYFNRLRSKENQNKMAIAVKAGIPFSLGTLLVVLWLTLSQLWNVFFKKEHIDYPLFILTTFSVTYYILTLTHTLTQEWSYVHGGWLPRHVMPALLSFFILAFVGIDKWLAKRPLFYRIILMGFIIFQSCLHFSFLWVRGN